MSQSRSLLEARIELRIRHLREWDILVNTQKAVWRLISKETDQKLLINSSDKLVCLALRREQFSELSRIMANQREERHQMKAHHRHQVATLRLF